MCSARVDDSTMFRCFGASGTDLVYATHVVVFLPTKILIFRDCCYRLRRRSAYKYMKLGCSICSRVRWREWMGGSVCAQPHIRPSIQWQDIECLVNEIRIILAGIRRITRCANVPYFRIDFHCIHSSLSGVCVSLWLRVSSSSAYDGEYVWFSFKIQ